MDFTLEEIAAKSGLALKGDPTLRISGVASLANANADQITFLFNPKFKEQLSATRAAAVVLRQEDIGDYKGNALISSQPRLAWATIAALFDRTPVGNLKQHESAIVSPSATIGSDVTIGAHAVIEAGARIDHAATIGAGCFVGEAASVGERTELRANVTLHHGVTLGSRCLVHSGAVIGADGFGFEFEPESATFKKIPQVYGVIVGNDVEVGAGTTIDRGALNDTRVGDGVKLDNQVQIGHGTEVGDNTVISGCTAIAGSTRIGRYCLIGGAVGIVDNIEIGDHVEITAMSLVSKSISDKGRYSSGTGLMPGRLWRRNIVAFSRLDEMLKRLRKLEREN